MKKKIIIIGVLIGAIIVVGIAFLQLGKTKPESSANFEDYVKIGQYKELEAPKEEKGEVTAEEVDAYIKQRLETTGEISTIKKGKVEDGNYVVIDYDAKVGGKSFENSAMKDVYLRIGAGQIIEGLDKGLIGVEMGKTKALTLKFPDNYGDKELAGKEVVYTVKVKHKVINNASQLTDKWVKDNTEFKNIEEYKEETKKELEEIQEKSTKDSAENILWTQVIGTSEMKKDKDDKPKYPKEDLNEAKKEAKASYKEIAENLDMKWEDFLSEYMDTDEESFDETITEQAKSVVFEKLVIYGIADKEGIKVSKEDKKEYIKNKLDELGLTDKEYKKQFGKTYEEDRGKNNIEKEILLEKVKTFIYENTK